MSILDELMGEYGFSVPKRAYDKLQEHIAARQTVGQEPVGYMTAFGFVAYPDFDEIPVGTKFYAAPPAQAVDECALRERECAWADLRATLVRISEAKPGDSPVGLALDAISLIDGSKAVQS